MTKAPEPEDKLDATTHVVVNGPEDAPFDWQAIDWRRVEDDVRRLRQRIFTASKAGDLGEGPQPADVDAAVAREHAVERAAGDRAQTPGHDAPAGASTPLGTIDSCRGHLRSASCSRERRTRKASARSSPATR